MSLSWWTSVSLGLTFATGVGSATAINEVALFNDTVRVQALSPTLLRVEPVGPLGFEDRNTFFISGNRSAFAGVVLTKRNESVKEAFVSNEYWTVHVQALGGRTCSLPKQGMAAQVSGPQHGLQVKSQQECTALCRNQESCMGYNLRSNLCTLLSGWYVLMPDNETVFGKCSSKPSFTVFTETQVLFDSSEVLDKDTPGDRNLLFWPSPLEKAAYAIEDFPRFFLPEWGPTPMSPAEKRIVNPATLATNGFDFRNNVNGDTYCFLLGADLTSWHSARQEFNLLSGSTPILPDWAYGTWFTYWHQYSFAEATADINRWEIDRLPLDVWGLDMNWRNTTHDQDRYYNHPNTTLFPNFTEWFSFLKQKGIKSYFNDHPYQMAPQTSEQEVAFRWKGLTEWMEKGLDYWWFDRNWGISIGPPFVNTSETDGDWMGLDNAAWGSYVYYSIVAKHKANQGQGHRPITLTKHAAREPWMQNSPKYPGVPGPLAESPAQRRYPVWWTGDSVQIDAAVMGMVDAGVHALKPFVHSDCGGDGIYHSDIATLRWTSHCVLGTILRFHGDDHRPWNVTSNRTEATIRSYLNMRYRLIPSLIAAGQQATKTAFPLVARADLFWPEYAESRSNTSYLLLNDTLVAPIFDMQSNVSSREVWIPPGDWEDGWNGTITSGPKAVTTTQPFDRIPMWHRRGSLTVTVSEPATRVAEQNWDELTMEVYPGRNDNVSDASKLKPQAIVRKYIYERGTAEETCIEMHTERQTGGTAVVVIELSGGPFRAWCVRIHLLPGQRATSMRVDGGLIVKAREAGLRHFSPLLESEGAMHFPFGGKGTQPPPSAGAVAEFTVDCSRSCGTSIQTRRFEVYVVD